MTDLSHPNGRVNLDVGYHQILHDYIFLFSTYLIYNYLTSLLILARFKHSRLLIDAITNLSRPDALVVKFIEKSVVDPEVRSDEGLSRLLDPAALAANVPLVLHRRLLVQPADKVTSHF